MRILEFEEAEVGDLCFLPMRVPPGCSHWVIPTLSPPHPEVDCLPSMEIEHPTEYERREFVRTLCSDGQGNRFEAWTRIR